MPNWVPSDEHLDRFKQAVNAHLMKRVYAMEAGFPLNLDEVKLVTTPPQLAELLALGLDSLNTTGYISFEVGPNEGAARRSVVKVHFERPTYYAYRNQIGGRLITAGPPIYFNNGLDPETHKKLIEWVDRSVYERRLYTLTNLTVAEFLRHTPGISLYHIAARWPVLKVMFPLIQSTYSRYSISSRYANIWERHGNEMGRNLNRWGWPVTGPEAEWRYRNLKRMQLAENAILSVMSLPEPASRPVFWAEITDWERLNNQIV